MKSKKKIFVFGKQMNDNLLFSGDCILIPCDGGGDGGDELQLETEDQEGGAEGRGCGRRRGRGRSQVQ